jgi:hypothetical protein
MSSCEKCWNTPCNCGWNYKGFAPADLTKFIANITAYRTKAEAKSIIANAVTVVDEMSDWQNGNQG